MTQLGKGRAAAVSDAEIAALADEFRCHPADLEAIAEVESSGFGWFRDGRMKILFEKHVFYKQLAGDERARAVSEGLARAKWISPKKGGYRDQQTADQRYGLLERAAAINREAAYRSISMGRFQIMGFNQDICGFASAEEMWGAFLDSEVNQLRAFAGFLKSKNLVAAIRRRDFAAVEETYNGGGLGGAYADRMRIESNRLRAGKWKGYEPGSPTADADDEAEAGPILVPRPVIEEEGERPEWTPEESHIEDDLGEAIKPPKPLGRSKTLWNTVIGIFSSGGAGFSLSALMSNPKALWIIAILLGFTLAAGIAGAIIFRERILKRLEHGI